jgi:glycosyltransferase involved in cell wall biosynthesis
MMIAYHYPPEGSSSGVQRTLKFSQYLAEHGWSPIVISAHPRAYLVSRTDQLSDIPESIPVRRAFALDSARHLALAGRYLGVSALPDRWVSWWPPAVWTALRVVRQFRPKAIWSTYPIATAHLIGWSVRRLTGLPWIADFRDSMTEDEYPRDPRQRRVYRWLERKTMQACSRAVFTTPSTVRMYAQRYPQIPSERFALVPNGFDEENFVEAEGLPSQRGGESSKPVVLLHSGALYPSERDPRCFYRAIEALQREGRIDARSLRIVLRATGHDAHHRRLIEEHGIQEVVVLEPSLPYREALREMMDADGLLVFQASNCNHQVPAKIYEYMRARRPILALTDPSGDTAATLRSAGVGDIVPLDDEEAIKGALPSFVRTVREGRAAIASEEEVSRHSRRARSGQLAALLNEVALSSRTDQAGRGADSKLSAPA